MRNTKKTKNKHQQNLVTLISTLNYLNTTFEQYTQSDILHYFNGNMKRNGQKPIKLKTLQNYLYKLEKIFKITKNYHRHLGVNMGTEIYYSLKYTKKECYRIINKHFRDKKKNRYKNRVNDYLKKIYVKNGSVEKWECSYNIYNNKKEEEKNKKSVEKLQVEKYAKKCNFKSKEFYSILDLKIDKDNKIELLKIFKRTENYFESKNDGKANTNQSKSEVKKRELIRILNETKYKLENEGYNKEQLKTQIQKVYELYKHKPHFIIENNKYNDLKKIIEKLKKSVEHAKKNTREDAQNIRNNIFSILLEQLKHKVGIQVLIPILKDYLNKQDKLTYNKVLNNYYYYELLGLVKNKKNYLRLGECEKIVT
ncbi:plasmid maintenance protein (plasmid) [Borrelia miyamotoi]|uniref:Plasmid maintenance protein n=2 Tax=Borrelia miyamotoi TaxID=47466 RepID=A0AAQ3CPA0_9SPIR|nr:plasmid maintenance protein [Borrelia miyamotoi]AHH05855.1 Hypothetical protein BOM_1312 [Borrelia miyamotoi FR64b]ATQ15496.1 plasmid maintenance protein [Borrelia miyamotoi]ATQ16601.1 plasmid maintenance protein [Borrelia miyamotoi]ATQ17774.1 plasmid maintenance protein [Borrelia miyamotoi]ATQ18994.1 plasmid maintenance protein [Borrelia miyamotoi]